MPSRRIAGGGQRPGGEPPRRRSRAHHIDRKPAIRPSSNGAIAQRLQPVPAILQAAVVPKSLKSGSADLPVTTFERVLKLFPGFLAGGLALVYILGAIVTGSEMSGAGMDPPDVIPLLSIEQLLARGVGVLVQSKILLSLALLS